MSRRTNHVMREFVASVEAAIQRNGMSIERAAELLLEHHVPAHITARVLARAQQKQPLPTLSA